MTRADLVNLVGQFRTEHPDLDRHATSMLDRLISADWARHVLPAFCAVRPEKRRVLLADCVRADLAARTHAPAVEHAQVKIQTSGEAAKALKTIAAFLDRDSPAFSPDALDEALHAIRASIDNTKRDAERTLREHSRKTTNEAARALALGWLAESMNALTGKPHTRLVADLAMAVLNCEEEITEAAVRKATTPQLQLARGRRWGTR